MFRKSMVLLLLIFITQTLSLSILKNTHTPLAHNPITSVHELFSPTSPTTTHEAPTEIHEAPNLPLYVGRGYNILSGNPLADTIDPGFQHPIFNMTYVKQSLTEDGRFQIADGVSFVKKSSCSFASKSSTFRGTQSYQSILSTKATVAGGYQGAAVSAKFSLSTSYSAMQKQTTEQKKTVTQTTAQCETYLLSIDMFTPLPILSNFENGVKISMKNKNWTDFITQFGTHYIYQVIMGGRSTQEITYSQQSYSKMQSLNIDINIAAKASYAAFSGDVSFDIKNQKEDISYVNKLSQSKKQFYIGGKPQFNGNSNAWYQSILPNPMPISYKMIGLANLFQHINDTDQNKIDAVKQFNSAVDAYCKDQNCTNPNPDRPRPAAATIITYRTEVFGCHNYGTVFDWSYNSTTFNAVKFIVRSSPGNIHNLQMVLGDGVRKMHSPAQGGTGGWQNTWQVPQGEYVIQVEMGCYQAITRLTFITNKGNKSPNFGGNGGQYQLISFPQNYRIIGFSGRAGTNSPDRLDRLSFILAKTIYPSGAGSI